MSCSLWICLYKYMSTHQVLFCHLLKDRYVDVGVYLSRYLFLSMCPHVCLFIYSWLNGNISIHAGLFIHHLLTQSSVNNQTDGRMNVGVFLHLDPHSRFKRHHRSECWRDCVKCCKFIMIRMVRSTCGHCVLKTCFGTTVHCSGARSRMVEVSLCKKTKSNWLFSLQYCWELWVVWF